jgi:hypothetical protein
VRRLSAVDAPREWLPRVESHPVTPDGSPVPLGTGLAASRGASRARDGGIASTGEVQSHFATSVGSLQFAVPSNLAECAGAAGHDQRD